ncbi:MAG: redoxin domain-containing protein [Candidatus Dormibacteria bacterium]
MKRWLAVILSAAVIAGALVFAVSRISSTSSGRLLVLASVVLPAPSGQLRVQLVGLRVMRAGAGWESAPLAPDTVSLPGSYLAPNAASLAQVALPAGGYTEAELELRTGAGGLLRDLQTVSFQVRAAQTTPLLFTFHVNGAQAGSGLVPAAAYGGSSQVSFGLALASDQIRAVPGTGFINQLGQPVHLSQYRGQVVVLASFLTECQETCPLVAAALLQLRHLLQQHGLSNQVQIVEVTQDPGHDTPALLTKYQRHFSLPWQLLTGSTSAINGFWSQLGVPPVQALAWGGPAPLDLFTGRPEPYNLVHASVVEVINPQGYIVTVMQSWPALGTGSIPPTIYKYLDAQGRSQQKTGGSWTPQTLLQAITPLLQQERQVTAFPGTTAATPGHLAPDFTLLASDGGQHRLSQLRGHPVMLDFWASWCANCKADMSLVAKAASQYRSQGLRVVLIDEQESATTATRFLSSIGVHLPTLFDRHGTVAQGYGLPGLPVAVFIDPSGRVAALVMGQLQPAQLSASLAKLLAN